ERIHRVDRGLLFLNLWLLLGIAFLPFPTALLAEYVRSGGADAHAAAAIYSATMMLIGFAFLSIWVHLSRRPFLLGGAASGASLRRSINLSLVSPVVYGGSIGLAFISAEACIAVYALAALYFAAGPSSRALSPLPQSRLLERQAATATEPLTGDASPPPAADDDEPSTERVERLEPVDAGAS